MENGLKGLSEKEVLKLREKYGYNEIVKNEKPNALKKFIGVFKEPMFLLLLGTALLYFLLKEPKEAAIMMVFVIFVAAITFIQEWKTEKTMAALKDLTSPEVHVLRDGKVRLIKSTELVPGDIVYIAEGERIPADCRVIEASNFSVDESVLTGEAEHVFKSSEEDISGEYWKKNMLYAGTLSIFGKCTALVIETGFNTEYGKIGKEIGEVKEEPTPLQRKVSKLVKGIAVFSIFLCLLVIIFSYFYTGKLVSSLLAGVTLAMAMIPEEFPVVMTVFLSLGAFRLAKKNTLMRKISAVETLGSTTILCVDKTGTITENKMKVKSLFFNGKTVYSEEFKEKDISRLLILSCEKEPYDPMEKAMVEVGSYNVSKEEAYSMELAHKYAFDPVNKMVGNVFGSDKDYYIAVKGSPETVLPLCKNKEEREEVLRKVDEFASKGLRVLALADANIKEINNEISEYELNFKALVGLFDPPKKNVKESIKLCKEAGIRVVMITGDYNKTAAAIGKEIGLKFSSKSITGDEIENMSDEELKEAVDTCDVFSRVIPKHKMRIIKALKARGEIVAMTGDGVNDAPALKNADIGIAMGGRGTEVAKEASHMVIMDDDFTTIVNSVEDGRRVFDNIRKAIVYIMIIHIPIAAIALFAPLFNLPQILLPMHIMFLELIIDPTCSIVFEGEKAEPNSMRKPPRSPEESILPREYLVKILLQGFSMFLACFMPFHYMVDSGITVEAARSFSLVTLIISNITLVMVNRSNTQYLFHAFKEKGNKIRFIINSAAFLILICIIYVPFMRELFFTEKLSAGMFLLAMALGFASVSWWEIVKAYKNHNKNINWQEKKVLRIK